MKTLVLLIGLAVAVCVSTAGAGMAPITMELFGPVGQSTVYRGLVNTAGTGSVFGLSIADSLVLRGSTGVFSGFDVDFVCFDADGDLATTNDRVYPLLNGSTFVTPGAVDLQATSMYQPTTAHPGPLFGLNADGSIDHATATLRQLDAQYQPGVGPLSVNTSDGWVTLGDGGRLDMGFPLFSVLPGESMYLFIADAGVHEDEIAADITVQFFDSFQLFFVDGSSSSVATFGPGTNISLDTSFLGDYGPNAVFRWDLDGDGQFDDAVGHAPIVSYEYLVGTLGLDPNAPGPHLAYVQVSDGSTTDEHQVTMEIPEPASATLLALGALALLRRRTAR